MAEDLTDYFKELGLKVKYLHSDIKTLERTEIIRDLRLGEFDILIGINLLREGIDVPEVSLIAILDADKEGLRSERSLVQTMGRAARNAEGKVIMYADKITDSMQRAMDETARRRAIQEAYNEEHGIEPKQLLKEIRDLISISKTADKDETVVQLDKSYKDLSRQEKADLLMKLEREMKDAAKALDFETAATLRDTILN